MSKAFSSLTDTFTSAFDLLPESLKNVGSALFSQAGSILSGIGRMFTDFFSKLDLSALMPDSLKSAFGWMQSKLGFGDGSGRGGSAVPAMALASASGIPNRDVYSNTPVAAIGGEHAGNNED